MMEEQILNALTQVDSQYVEEAFPPQKKKHRTFIKKWVSLAACFCLVAMTAAFTGQQYYYTESSYISIDVNPSIELCLNPLNRVIGATAYNEDGQEVLSHLELDHLTYEEAIDSLLQDECFRSYLHADADLTFTIVSDKGEVLSQGITECAQDLSLSHSIHHSDLHTLQEAHSHHYSVGKYAAYQTLAQCDPSVTLEECKDLSMHEIHARIDACSDGSQTHHHAGNSTASSSAGAVHHSEPFHGRHN